MVCERSPHTFEPRNTSVQLVKSRHHNEQAARGVRAAAVASNSELVFGRASERKRAGLLLSPQPDSMRFWLFLRKAPEASVVCFKAECVRLLLVFRQCASHWEAFVLQWEATAMVVADTAAALAASRRLPH